MTFEEFRAELDAVVAEHEVLRPEDPASTSAFSSRARRNLLALSASTPASDIACAEADLAYLDGVLADAAGSFDDAIDAFQRAIDISIETGDEHRRIVALRSLALTYENSGRQASATEAISEALDRAHRLDDARTLALVSLTLCALYQAQGAWSSLLASATRTVEYAERADDVHLSSRAYSGMGVALSYQRHPEEGLEWIERARRTIADDASSLEELFLDLNRWFLLRRMGRTEEIAALVTERVDALDLMPSADATRLAVMIADVLREVGDLHGAAAMLNRAEQLAINDNVTSHQIDFFRVSAEIHAARGDAIGALQMTRQYARLDRKLRGRTAEARLLDIERRFERELAAKSAEIERLRTVELAEKNDQLSALIRQKEEIMRVIAHDLRNPLAAAQMLGDSLLHDLADGNPDVIERLGAMSAATSEMRQRIDVLLADDPQPTEPLTRPVSDAVRLAVSAIADRADHMGVPLSTRVDDVDVAVDEAILRCCVEGLLDKALATAPDDAALEVLVEQRGGGAHIELRATNATFGDPDDAYLTTRLIERMRGTLAFSTARECGSAVATIDLRPSPTAPTVDAGLSRQ